MPSGCKNGEKDDKHHSSPEKTPALPQISPVFPQNKLDFHKKKRFFWKTPSFPRNMSEYDDVLTKHVNMLRKIKYMNLIRI